LSARQVALAALLTAGCEAAEPPPPAPLALDCGRSFESLTAAVTAQDLIAAPVERAEPYRFWSAPDGRTSYLVTQPGAPGHPAVMMQQMKDGQVVTTGCPYGDRAGYDQLHAYLDSLKTWRRTP